LRWWYQLNKFFTFSQRVTISVSASCPLSSTYCSLLYFSKMLRFFFLR
jgi:hypothetical protein